MFDTHCHLNFSRFKKNHEEVYAAAKKAGVEYIVAPGTDLKTSKKAIEIASLYEGVYAAVGIHPHHVYELKLEENPDIEVLMSELKNLITQPKVVAIGEVGMDRHVYQDTKYESYSIDERFVELQKVLLQKQIQLAVKSNKSLIIHNREAKHDLLPIVHKEWDKKQEHRAVFHCCEPDQELVEFAKSHKMFLGIDGDITYFAEKQAYIKNVPLEMLVLETDSPFLLPEPLKSQKLYPNKPENIAIVAQWVANIKNISLEEVTEVTTLNAKQLFQIS